MLRRLAIAVFLLFTFASLALAQVAEGRRITTWETVFSERITVDHRQGRVVVSIAPATIKRSEETVQVWLRFLTPEGSGFVKPDTNFGETRFRVVFTCQDIGHASARTALAYDRSGHYLFGQDYEESAAELPGTLSKVLFDYFCERGTTPTEPPRLKRVYVAQANKGAL